MKILVAVQNIFTTDKDELRKKIFNDKLMTLLRNTLHYDTIRHVKADSDTLTKRR